jgi:hypothetical protein
VACGVDHRPVRLELDVAGGGGEARPGRRPLVQPVGQAPGLGVANRPDGLVAGAQATELGQVLGRPGERPAGPGQAQQFLGLRADEALQAQPLVERVAAGLAAGADEIEAAQADLAGGGQELTAGPPLVPGEPAAPGAAPAGRPFFSAASACC